MSVFNLPCCLGKEPNVLFILADDLGSADVSYNSELRNAKTLIRTPGLDELASESVRLSQFYAAPACTPTRASLMTGRYQHQAGLVFPLPPWASTGLNLSHTILPQELKTRGYSTYLVGKWHLGGSVGFEEYMPHKRGFDEYFGAHSGEFDYYTKKTSADSFDLWRNGVQEFDPLHATLLWTREANGVVDRHMETKEETPFFLYLAYTAPHDPLTSHPDHLAECAHIKNWRRREYCGLVKGLDEGVMNVTSNLKRHGIFEDTIIIFMSDNGGMPAGGGLNYPFKGRKGSMWEGGIHVPAFIRLGNTGPGGYWYDGLMHVSDWYPTIMSLVSDGTHKLQSADLSGVDLSAALKADDVSLSKREVAILHHDYFGNCSAFIKGRWKLVLGRPGEQDWWYAEADEHMVNADAGAVGRIFEFAADLLQKMDPGKPVLQWMLIHNGMQMLLDAFSGLPKYNNLGVFPPTIRDTNMDNSTGPAIKYGWAAAVHPSVDPEQVFLYDMKDDYLEAKNLAAEKPEIVAELLRDFERENSKGSLQYSGNHMFAANMPKGLLIAMFPVRCELFDNQSLRHEAAPEILFGGAVIAPATGDQRLQHILQDIIQTSRGG
ncbi:hypothetical protein CYMTET_55934 [Cymbomonas tetramitiformis]|uniref:Sulfatase N-terminal domain-containing protein n=1 Tax=Cymbomonas tetramitiformis TaxID=36881 RepID=A0AAE0BBZ0_9CHLO|nr:hypothetical protein CYMTET_55934 [Cymbomonas tetramitiformis]